MDFCGFFAQVDELLKDKAVAMDLEVNLKWITIHQAVNSTDDVLVRDKRLVESVEFLLQEFQKNPALSVDYLREFGNVIESLQALKTALEAEKAKRQKWADGVLKKSAPHHQSAVEAVRHVQEIDPLIATKDRLIEEWEHLIKILPGLLSSDGETPGDGSEEREA